jgi:hypothetical protein
LSSDEQPGEDRSARGAAGRLVAHGRARRRSRALLKTRRRDGSGAAPPSAPTEAAGKPAASAWCRRGAASAALLRGRRAAWIGRGTGGRETRLCGGARTEQKTGSTRCRSRLLMCPVMPKSRRVGREVAPSRAARRLSIQRRTCLTARLVPESTSDGAPAVRLTARLQIVADTPPNCAHRPRRVLTRRSSGRQARQDRYSRWKQYLSRVSSFLLNELRSDLTRGQAVIIAGAGVTMSSVQEDRATQLSWGAIVRAGMERALEVNRRLPQPLWREAVEADIRLGEEGVSDGYISAASKVSGGLGGPKSPEFAAWMEDTFGRLAAVRPQVIQALGALRCPIYTTNYDSLISEVLGRAVTDWTQAAEVQATIAGRSEYVVHLHGHWRSPGSVVFGAQSYSDVLSDPAAQALQQALSITHSLIFVGCGDTVSDPNVGGLLKWLGDVLPASRMRRYVLVRGQDEVAAVPGGLSALSYGDSHEDLATFLNGLSTPAEQLRLPLVSATPDLQILDNAREARAALQDDVRSKSLLLDRMRDVQSRSIDELLIPPVLLPIPYEQFVTQRHRSPELGLKRLDPVEEAKSGATLLLVAEESSGLTSALSWLLFHRQAAKAESAPVLVDFRSVGSGNEPLLRAAHASLLGAGALTSKRDPLPRCVLALDNLSSAHDKKFHRVLGDLQSEQFGDGALIGCRSGTEATISAALRNAGVTHEVRYLGKLGVAEAALLAELVEPSRAQALAQRALDVAQREHLSRTPYTLSLLIIALMQGEALFGTASETSLLDLYITLLLGKGELGDDSRFRLDSTERSGMLGALAERYVLADAGSLSQEEVVGVFGDYFRAVGWREEPVPALMNFAERRILTIRQGQVRFSQSSYLHLFAARQAVLSSDFKTRLLERPLYYAPILRHYTALTRHDVSVLRAIRPLLMLPSECEIMGTSFVPGVATEPRELEASPAEDRDDDGTPTSDDRDEPALVEWLNLGRDRDPDPFPTTSSGDAHPLETLLETVVLASSVLRDSEMVLDLDLKRDVLKEVLHAWGCLVGLLEQDEGYQELVRLLITEILSGRSRFTNERKQDMIDEFVDSSPLLSALGGIKATLASNKLDIVLEDVFADEASLQDPRTAVMAAFLAFVSRGEAWTRQFALALNSHRETYAAQTVMQRIATMAYLNPVTPQRDLEGMEEFLPLFLAARGGQADAATVKLRSDKVLAQLKNRRLLARARVLEEGKSSQTVIEGELA